MQLVESSHSDNFLHSLRKNEPTSTATLPSTPTISTTSTTCPPAMLLSITKKTQENRQEIEPMASEASVLKGLAPLAHEMPTWSFKMLSYSACAHKVLYKCLQGSAVITPSSDHSL